MRDGDFTDDTNIRVTPMRQRADGDGVLLVVVTQSGVAHYPLPPTGEVTVGRSDGCSVCVDDQDVSRQHAMIRLGPELELTDLSSRNGTFLHGRLVSPSAPSLIAIGDVVEIGSTLLVLKTAPEGSARRRCTQGFFDERLEGTCRRAGQSGDSFAVMALRFDGDALDEIDREVDRLLRPTDLICRVGSREYEVLMPGVKPGAADAILKRVQESGSAFAAAVTARIACGPRDGRTPAALRAAMGEHPKEAPPGGVKPASVPAPLRALVERVAGGTINVVILGETGVGKDVLTETIHRLSPRAHKPLLRLNCASFSETLLESELFGYERGAFTGAERNKSGLLETAEGGTVFFDEVGELPLSIQAKLLHVIEQRKVMRVGGLRERPIDVRIIAATNRDLEADVAAGKFRQDLLFRLNGILLKIPPLRERAGEIEGLANEFLEQARRRIPEASARAISPEVLELLKRYRWPGNIRELRNMMERAVLLCGGPIILPEHLPLDKLLAATPAPEVQLSKDPSSPEEERQQILAALERCAGNQTRAAKMLGISRRTLVSRLGEYALPRPRKA